MVVLYMTINSSQLTFILLYFEPNFVKLKCVHFFRNTRFARNLVMLVGHNRDGNTQIAIAPSVDKG